MVKVLNQLRSGEQGMVNKIVGAGVIQRRLLDMGITPGTAIQVQKFAPLGDPMEIKAKGFNLSLRKAEAESIQVDVAL